MQHSCPLRCCCAVQRVTLCRVPEPHSRTGHCRDARRCQPQRRPLAAARACSQPHSATEFKSACTDPNQSAHQPHCGCPCLAPIAAPATASQLPTDASTAVPWRRARADTITQQLHPPCPPAASPGVHRTGVPPNARAPSTAAAIPQQPYRGLRYLYDRRRQPQVPAGHQRPAKRSACGHTYAPAATAPLPPPRQNKERPQAQPPVPHP